MSPLLCRLSLSSLAYLSSSAAAAAMSSTTHARHVVRRVGPANRDIVIEPPAGKRASALVILSHGLGDSADGWADSAADLARSLPYVKFYLPSAPISPVTLNGGARMPSWYDIVSLSRSRVHEPCDGLPASVARIHALVKDAGVPPSRVMLAGFSQGGALSLFSGLTWGRPTGAGAGAGGDDGDAPEPLGGIAVLSGYLPLPEEAKPTPAVAASTPVHFFHGSSDQVVLHEYGKASEAKVKEMGVTDVRFSTYRGMQHSACEEELADLLAFIKERLPPPSSA